MVVNPNHTNLPAGPYTLEHVNQWCRRVIYQVPVSIYRQHRSWMRDELGLLQDIRAAAHTENLWNSGDSYSEAEWHLLLDTALPPDASCVIEALYFKDQAQTSPVGMFLDAKTHRYITVR